jgi:hypothetical protein
MAPSLRLGSFKDARAVAHSLRKASRITVSQADLLGILATGEPRPSHFSLLSQLTAVPDATLNKDAAFLWSEVVTDALANHDVEMLPQEDGAVLCRTPGGPIKVVVLARDLKTDRAADDFYVQWYATDGDAERTPVVTGYGGPTRMLTLSDGDRLYVRQATDAAVTWTGESTSFRVFRARYATS